MGSPVRKGRTQPHAALTGSTQTNPALKDSLRSNMARQGSTRSNLAQKDRTQSNPAPTDSTPPAHPARGTVDEVESRRVGVAHCNRQFAGLSAEQRVERALEDLPAEPVLSSSFGAQAAVMLHLVTRAMPDIPVILVDTGYLFPETYRFVDELTERLRLNLKVYRAELSPAWQEARYGKRWLDGAAGIDAYNRQNKVEPMQRALDELNAGTWFAGLRRAQSASRADRPFLEWSGDRWKVHPIADWSDRDVYRYLQQYDLPYHPLWDKGYVSIGDHHTTRALHEVDDIEQTRFFGVRRECGLHEMDTSSRGA